MKLYTVTAIHIHDGSKHQIAAPLTSKRAAVKLAEATKAPGIYCEVSKSESGVTPHRISIHQTATGS